MTLHAQGITWEERQLLCVVGPTASGKTELAIRICEQVGGEIVSADSVQVYRHFNVGTGKPSAEELVRARHHLVDILEPDEPMDAARFAELATECISDIRGRGKVPIVCGGSFLWVLALVEGLAQAPAADASLRSLLEEDCKQFGLQTMHDRLRALDPIVAERLNPHDKLRVLRALEVIQLTGRRLSDLHAEHKASQPRHDAVFVGVEWTPEALLPRIARRAGVWLDEGWIDEVSRLLCRGFRDTRPMGSVGYKQVVEHLDGSLPSEILLEKIVRSTKIFARRQRTWLRDRSVTWLKATET